MTFVDPGASSGAPLGTINPNMLSQQQLMSLWQQQLQTQRTKASDYAQNWAGGASAAIDDVMEARRQNYLQQNILPRILGNSGGGLPDLRTPDPHAADTDVRPQADVTTATPPDLVSKTATYENSPAYALWAKGDTKTRLYPYDDGKNWKSIGFGTQALKGDENGITVNEAYSRLLQELGHASGQVSAFAPDLSPGWHSALTDLTFNAGTKWTKAGLGQAVKAGDWGEAANRFTQYNKADVDDGQGLRTLPGLLKRRMDFLQGAVPGGQGSAVAGVPQGASSSPAAGGVPPGNATQGVGPQAGPAAPPAAAALGSSGAPTGPSPSQMVAGAFGGPRNPGGFAAAAGRPAITPPGGPAAPPGAAAGATAGYPATPPAGQAPAPGFAQQPPSSTAPSSATGQRIPPDPAVVQQYNQLMTLAQRYAGYPQGTREHDLGLEYFKQANDLRAPKTITLPDGTQVVGSQLQGYGPSNLPREPTEAEKRSTGTQAEMDTKYWGGIQQGIRSGGLLAARQQPQIDALEAMSKDKNFIATGTLTGKIEKLGIGLGINPGSANAGVNQLANTLLTENLRALAATNQSVGMGGGGGEAHVGLENVERLATSLADDNTPAGLQMKIALIKRMAASNDGLADIEERYSGDHGGRLDAGFYGSMRAFSKSQKLFDPKDLEVATAPANPNDQLAQALIAHKAAMAGRPPAPAPQDPHDAALNQWLQSLPGGTGAPPFSVHSPETMKMLGSGQHARDTAAVGAPLAAMAIPGVVPTLGRLAGKGALEVGKNAWHWAPYLIHELMKGGP